MSAIDFIPHKIELKVQLPEVKHQHKESHRLAYYLVSHLSLDLADSFSYLTDRKEIPDIDTKFFDNVAVQEYEYMESLATEKGKEDIFVEDFNIISNAIDNLVNRSLSDFQRKSKPILSIILKSIYQIQLITHSAWHVATSEGKTINPKMDEILQRKLKQLKIAFMKHYTQVSNFKDFNFDQFDNIFKQLAHSTYSEFNNTISNF